MKRPTPLGLVASGIKLVENRPRSMIKPADFGEPFEVRKFGGVLEQPKGSKLWERCSIPMPGASADAWGGVSIEVAQVDWGHVARKRTWLYLVRIAVPTEFPPAREPTHWVSGGRHHVRKGSGGVVPPGIKVCSAQQRRRTPPAFAEFLVALARSVRPQLSLALEAA